jgi:hypothetical protein
MAKPAKCYGCGQTWPRDPRLEVPCPSCFARVGQRCVRPSEWRGNFVGIHVARERAAVEAGYLSKTCPAVSGAAAQK